MEMRNVSPSSGTYAMLDSWGRPLERMVARTPWLRLRANATASVRSMPPTVAASVLALDDDLVLGPVGHDEMDHGRNDRSDEWCDQEDPDLAERRTAHDEGRSEGPGRAHRGARQRNADEGLAH